MAEILLTVAKNGVFLTPSLSDSLWVRDGLVLTGNLFFFVKNPFSLFSLVSSNHASQCTTKIICNKRGYRFQAKPRIQAPRNISLFGHIYQPIILYIMTCLLYQTKYQIIYLHIYMWEKNGRYITSFTPPRFQMSVPRQESERSYICVLRVTILVLSTLFN